MKILKITFVDKYSPNIVTQYGITTLEKLYKAMKHIWVSTCLEPKIYLRTDLVKVSYVVLSIILLVMDLS